MVNKSFKTATQLIGHLFFPNWGSGGGSNLSSSNSLEDPLNQVWLHDIIEIKQSSLRMEIMHLVCVTWESQGTMELLIMKSFLTLDSNST